MKYLSLLILGLHLCIFSTAQPVLQVSFMLPKGIKIPFGIGNTTNPGAAGANVTWDFSTLPLSPGGTFECIDAATSPYSGTFPTCNYVIKVNTSTTFYNYYNLTGLVYEWVGVRMGLVNANLTPNPQILLKFPFNYNDKVIDTVKSTDSVYNGVDTVVYDGYGTLKTPYGTYTNAIRVKSTDETGVSVYEWYIVDTTSPVHFTYSVVRIEPNNTRIFNYHPTTVNTVFQDVQISVYPNPVTDIITVSSTNIINGKIHIYDETGKVVLEYVLKGKATKIHVGSLATGKYEYQIISNYNEVLQKGKLQVVH